MINKNNKTEKTTATKLTAEENALVKMLDRVFTIGAWEIPDDAAEGVVTERLRKIEDQIAEINKRLNIAAPCARVDAVSMVKGKKK